MHLRALSCGPQSPRYTWVRPMYVLVFFTVLAFSLQMRNALEQRRRVLLLGHFLRRYRIETLMQNLVDGYLRALGESDTERRAAIWTVLDQTETQLLAQVQQLIADMGEADPRQWQASTLGLGLPLATHWAPQSTFDLRQLLRVHADGMAAVMVNAEGLSPRDRAYRLCAELLLLQHSCHWYCKSRWVASARMLARHKTHYAQLLGAVSPATRSSYARLTGI